MVIRDNIEVVLDDEADNEGMSPLLEDDESGEEITPPSVASGCLVV